VRAAGNNVSIFRWLAADSIKFLYLAVKGPEAFSAEARRKSLPEPRDINKKGDYAHCWRIGYSTHLMLTAAPCCDVGMKWCQKEGFPGARNSLWFATKNRSSSGAGQSSSKSLPHFLEGQQEHMF